MDAFFMLDSAFAIFKLFDLTSESNAKDELPSFL